MTYGSVEKARTDVEIQRNAPGNWSTSRVETASPLSGEIEMNEHFSNVDMSYRFIATLYQVCFQRYAEAPAERGAAQ